MKLLVAFLLVAVVAAAGCHPECKWQCNDPVCPAECHDVCERPKCEHRCEPVTCATCQSHCELPKCTIRCPVDHCSHRDDCPKCEVVCSKAECRSECESPKPQCAPVCTELKCWKKCDKPASCAKPKCALECEKSACEAKEEPAECCPCAEPQHLAVAVQAATATCAQQSACDASAPKPTFLEALASARLARQEMGVEGCCPCAEKKHVNQDYTGTTVGVWGPVPVGTTPTPPPQLTPNDGGRKANAGAK